MNPVLRDDWLTIWGGDCREVLATLPDESVHCVVTSPPYWGLRDYGTATWLGGDADCEHVGVDLRTADVGGPKQQTKRGSIGVRSGDCRCGAVRQDSQLGLEPTPEEYVANMVAVFREVRRVLRRDGTLWLNLGDTFNSGGGTVGAGKAVYTNGERVPNPRQTLPTLKPKDLVGIPWRVAFALQADGWYLRSDIIWSKPNPMPESVTDRPTKSHEYMFLLAKSERYYYDAEAVAEPAIYAGLTVDMTKAKTNGMADDVNDYRTRINRPVTVGPTRNRRSVWTIATRPYPGAHFAVFPPDLVEPCVKAGTSERGVCAECGAPWRRVVERGELVKVGQGGPQTKQERTQEGFVGRDAGRPGTFVYERETTGWEPSCTHDAASVPAAVLDPFAGSGTVGLVAQRLSRRAVLIDLNPDYLEQQMKRNRDIPLGLTAA